MSRCVLFDPGAPPRRSLEGELISRLEGEPDASERFEAGSLVGEYGLLVGEPRKTTVVALTPCVLRMLESKSSHLTVTY